MFRKNYFTFLLTLSLLLAGSLAAFAQTAPVSGKVVMQKADGTTEPVVGALVEAFRTDIKAKFPSDKTNKKGEFGFAGLPLGATFVFSVSAPNASPNYLPNVRAGSEKLVITLTEGDGKRWTEEEVRQSLVAGSAKTANTANTANTSTPDDKSSNNSNETPTPEQIAAAKKEQAEYEKKKAEVEAKNKQIGEKNVIIEKALKDGNEAFNSKNYDLAIAKYSEGIEADPEFVGTAPIMLNNKGVALKIRAVENYNKTVKSGDPTMKAELMPKVKQDLEAALISFDNSWKVLKAAQPAEITNKANYDKAKYDALNGLTDSYRLLVITKANPAKAAEASDAYTAYLEVETDAAKKSKAQVTFGDIMREAGDSEKAIVAYRAALQASTDNPDALAGLGLSLFNAGVVADDKAQMQEGLNFMTRFAEVAPDTHPLKSSVKDAVTYLKEQEKLTPQKVNTKKKN